MLRDAAKTLIGLKGAPAVVEIVKTGKPLMEGDPPPSKVSLLSRESYPDVYEKLVAAAS